MGMSEMGLAILGRQAAIAPVEYHLGAVKEVYESILETQQEVGGTLAYRAKTPSGGGKAFDILTGDEEMDTSVPSFRGVIVHSHKCNAYFDENTSGNTPPICSSVNGTDGFDSSTGEWLKCAGCPRNLYGTAKNGRGKACKNMHKLYIMTEELPVPVVLTLPPTSLKSFQTYCLNTLSVRRMKPQDVVTEFSLTSEVNQVGQKYSVVKFKLAGALPEEEKATAAYFAAGMAQAASVSAEDYNREDRPVKVDAEVDVTDFDESDIPF